MPLSSWRSEGWRLSGAASRRERHKKADPKPVRASHVVLTILRLSTAWIQLKAHNERATTKPVYLEGIRRGQDKSANLAGHASVVVVY
jgi:hypothetical protein